VSLRANLDAVEKNFSLLPGRENVPAAKNMHTTNRVTVRNGRFSIWLVLRCYNKDSSSRELHSLEYHDLCLARLEVYGRQPSIEIATPAKENSPHNWKFSKANNGSRFAHGSQTSVYM
jgi:hypothetical protein